MEGSHHNAESDAGRLNFQFPYRYSLEIVLIYYQQPFILFFINTSAAYISMDRGRIEDRATRQCYSIKIQVQYSI